jgi:glutathione S-transferase
MPRMKLYHSPTSPFARKVRIVAHERGLAADIAEVPSQLRTPQNAVLAHSATGKVPCLVVEDGPDRGLVMVESAAVCEYLNTLGDAPSLQPAPGGSAYWREKALDGYAHAFLDSIAWRGREGRRPGGGAGGGGVGVGGEGARRGVGGARGRAAGGVVGAGFYLYLGLGAAPLLRRSGIPRR